LPDHSGVRIADRQAVFLGHGYVAVTGSGLAAGHRNVQIVPADSQRVGVNPSTTSGPLPTLAGMGTRTQGPTYDQHHDTSLRQPAPPDLARRVALQTPGYADVGESHLPGHSGERVADLQTGFCRPGYAAVSGNDWAMGHQIRQTVPCYPQQMVAQPSMTYGMGPTHVDRDSLVTPLGPVRPAPETDPRAAAWDDANRSSEQRHLGPGQSRLVTPRDAVQAATSGPQRMMADSRMMWGSDHQASPRDPLATPLDPAEMAGTTTNQHPMEQLAIRTCSTKTPASNWQPPRQVAKPKMFDPDTDKWEDFVDQVTEYLEDAEVPTDQQTVVLKGLLSYGVRQEITLAKKSRATFDVLLKFLAERHGDRRLMSERRAAFHSARQRRHESMVHYADRLHALAAKSSLNLSEVDMADSLVAGMANTQWRNIMQVKLTNKLATGGVTAQFVVQKVSTLEDCHRSNLSSEGAPLIRSAATRHSHNEDPDSGTNMSGSAAECSPELTEWEECRPDGEGLRPHSTAETKSLNQREERLEAQIGQLTALMQASNERQTHAPPAVDTASQGQGKSRGEDRPSNEQTMEQLWQFCGQLHQEVENLSWHQRKQEAPADRPVPVLAVRGAEGGPAETNSPTDKTMQALNGMTILLQELLAATQRGPWPGQNFPQLATSFPTNPQHMTVPMPNGNMPKPGKLGWTTAMVPGQRTYGQGGPPDRNLGCYGCGDTKHFMRSCPGVCGQCRLAFHTDKFCTTRNREHSLKLIIEKTKAMGSQPARLNGPGAPA
jgi:hypothetical protein